MNIFVDANIYLGFIRLSQEKLNYLNNFLELVKKDKTLIFPKITQDEVFRNINGVARTYLNEIERWMPVKPQLAVNMENKKDEMSSLYKTYSQKIRSLKEEYINSVHELTESILTPLAKNALDVHEDRNIMKLAELRRERGNPPGKGPHLGDEIEWELLLQKCTLDELVLITNDSDWIDALSNEKENKGLHPFLLSEWKQYSKRKINYFDSLGGFMKTQQKARVAESDIERERQATRTVDNLVTFTTSGGLPSYYPSGTVTVVEPLASAAGTISGMVPTFTTTSTSFTTDYVTKCRNCGSSLDYFVYPFCVGFAD